MTAFNWMSHGTQDIYPTFLRRARHLERRRRRWIAIIYNIGAILGGTVFGSLSERFGRRRTIVLCACSGCRSCRSSPSRTTVGMLAPRLVPDPGLRAGRVGRHPGASDRAVPDEIRGFYPGVTYQLGNCLAAFNLPIQQALATATATRSRSLRRSSPCSSRSRC